MFNIPVSIRNPIIVTQGYHKDHKSIDIKNIDFNGDGLPVYCITDSQVIRIGVTDSGSNYIYLLDTSNGFFYTYVHTVALADIEIGDTLKGGECLGISDNSGRSSAPHLHLSIWNNEGIRINPLDFLNMYYINWEYSSVAIRGEK